MDIKAGRTLIHSRQGKAKRKSNTAYQSDGKTAGSEDGKKLRNEMSTLMNHIRICTLSSEQFCQEVAPSRVLSSEECVAVTIAIGTQEKQEELTEFCNEIKPREFVSKKKKSVLRFEKHTCISGFLLKDFNITVVTKECDVELLPLQFMPRDRQEATPEGATYEVGCTTTITRVTDCANCASTETPVTVRFDKQVEYGKLFEIPLIKNGRNVTLLPNSKYTIRMLFDQDQRMYIGGGNNYSGSYVNKHLSVHTTPLTANNRYTFHYIPLNQMAYKADANK